MNLPFISNKNPDIKIIAVAGAHGKSSVASILYSILNNAGVKTGLITNKFSKSPSKVENKSINSENLTKKSLNEYIVKLQKEQTELLIVEIGTNISIKNVFANIYFDVVILTNLISHKPREISWDEFALAKLNLISQLKDQGLLVVNGDEYDTKQLLMSNESFFENQILCYWSSKENIHDLVSSLENIHFKIGGVGTINSTHTSVFTPINYYQSIKAASHFVPINQILSSLEEIHHEKGAFNLVYKKPFKVIIDSAHTQSHITEHLQYLNSIKNANARIISILGIKGFHFEHNKYLLNHTAKLSDVTIVTSNDPMDLNVYDMNNTLIENLRNEYNDNIYLKRFSSTEEYELTKKDRLNVKINDSIIKNIKPVISFDHDDFTGRLDAIRFAFSIARTGDIIFITGKGFDTSTIYNSVEYEWSDYEAANLAMNEVLKD